MLALRFSSSMGSLLRAGIATALILSLLHCINCRAAGTRRLMVSHGNWETSIGHLYSRMLRSVQQLGVAITHSQDTLTPQEYLWQEASRKLAQEPMLEGELFRAVDQGDTAQVAQLVERGVDLDITNNNGNTPLIRAALRGHVGVIRVLLDAGADINIQGEIGATALYAAVELNQPAAIRILIEKGADLEIRTTEGATPLWRAAADNNLAIVKILLEAGADVDAVLLRTGQTPLLSALGSGNTVVVNELLDNGADIEATTPAGITSLHEAVRSGDVELVMLVLEDFTAIEATAFEAKLTPVMLAARLGHAEILRELIKQGANPNLIAGSRNRTALHWAAFDPENMAIMELLLNEGLDIDLTDAHGSTPLALAAWGGNKGNVEFLLNQGANPDASDIAVCGCLDTKSSGGCEPGNCRSEEVIQEIKDLLGVTAPQTVIDAVVEGDVELLEQLLADGADVAATDEDGNPPIIIAAARGKEEMVRILLNAEADVNATDAATGSNALHMAAFFGYTQITELLIVNGADLDDVDDLGFTALHLASEKGHLAVVQVLVDAGAQLDLRTSSGGSTALALAASNAHLTIVQKLLDSGADPSIKVDGELTLLMIASREIETEEILQLLIDEGIDVNAVSTSGMTALETAAYFGNKGAVKILLAAGADPSIGAGDGTSDRVCGCITVRGDSTLVQCPQGTCLTAEQIQEIESLLAVEGTQEDPKSPNTPPTPSRLPAIKTSGNVRLSIEQPLEEDCSSFSTLVAQLECVAAANDGPA